MNVIAVLILLKYVTKSMRFAGELLQIVTTLVMSVQAAATILYYVPINSLCIKSNLELLHRPPDDSSDDYWADSDSDGSNEILEHELTKMVTTVLLDLL